MGKIVEYAIFSTIKKENNMHIVSQTLAEETPFYSRYNVAVSNDRGHVETFKWTAGRLAGQNVDISDLETSLRDEARYLDDWHGYNEMGYEPSDAHRINEEIRENVRKMEALGWL